MSSKVGTLASLAVVGALSLAGCGRKETAPAVEKEKVVLCSFHPMYVMARNIAKDVPGVRVENMTGPQTGCLHDYQVTPADMRHVEDAWAFVVNGAGMEAFLGDVARRDPDLHVIEASRGIELIGGGHDHGHESGSHGEQGDGHHDEETNPHVWVSVSGAMAQVRNIADQLAELDTAHAALYRRNAEAYLARLDSLRARMHAAIDGLPNRRIVTFHEAFPYFAREFGLEIVSVVQREPGSEPGAKELAETIDVVRKARVKALFAEPQYPARAAEAIARETGIVLRRLDPAVSGGDDLDSYIRAMDSNTVVLREALSTR